MKIHLGFCLRKIGRTTLLFVSAIILLSCKESESPKSSTNFDTNTDSISTDTIGKDNQPLNQLLQNSISDSLFYIDGQICAWVRNIFQDSEGTLWFGTNHYGIMRYKGEELEYFSEKDGVGIGRITGVTEDKDGNIWFGTAGGLTKFDGNEFSNFKIDEGSYSNEIWSLSIDKKNRMWIGTSEGLIQFDGENFSPFPIQKVKVKDTTTVYSFNRISSVMEDRNGFLWLGTDGFGVIKYDPSVSSENGKGNFIYFTKENGLPDNSITDILEDSRGDIWIGTMFGGISKYDGKEFNNFTMDGIIKGIEVGGLYEDGTGSIWFAAENHGVYRYNGESFTNFNKEDGLNTNGILSIFKDKEGRFWFGGWGGLFRFDGKSFFSVTKDGPWNK